MPAINPRESTRDGFTPTIDDVPFDPEIVSGMIQYLPLDKNSLINSGVLFQSNRFIQLAGRNTGKITTEAFTFDDDEESQDWTGLVDGNTSKLPNCSQTSVVVGKYKAWEINKLANYIANGKTPEQAVLDYIQSYRDKEMFKIIKSILKGAFAATDVKEALTYDISTRAAKTEDYIKARALFWGDQAQAPAMYIMHSVVYTALMTQLTETTMVNFLQGATIIVDDHITTEADGVYETYIFRQNAIEWSGDLVGSGSFTQSDNLVKQGTDVIGYRRRAVFSPIGIDFKGTLANPTTATKTELETGTNWGLLDIPEANKRVRIGVLLSKESITPARAGFYNIPVELQPTDPVADVKKAQTIEQKQDKKAEKQDKKAE